MRIDHHFAPWAAAALGVVLLAGCTSDSAGPSNGQPLTAAQAAEVGAHLSHELTIAMSAMGASGQAGAPARIAGAMGFAPRATVGAGEVGAACPSLDNVIDSDGDGIPDNATASFALPQCRTVSGGDTTELTGTIHIMDPVASPPPNPAAFGFRATLTDFTVRFGAVNARASFSETRNGAEELLLVPEGLRQMHAMQIARHDSAGAIGVSETWQIAFAPVAGSALVPGRPLPSGTLVTGGSTTWQRSNDAAHFEIVTASPLTYDAGCAANAPTPFRAGELHAVLQRPGQQVVVRIVFAECGTPVVTLVAHG